MTTIDYQSLPDNQTYRLELPNGQQGYDYINRIVFAVSAKNGDELQRNILTERYVNNLKWDDIADKLYFSRQVLFKHHNKALEHLTRHNQF